MNLTLKTKILLLTILPLVAITLTLTWITQRQAQDLSERQVAIFEETVMDNKRRALEDYVNLAMTSIQPILAELDGGSMARSRVEYEVKSIIESMTFGPDGYFFAYDQKGTNLVHPALNDLIGTGMLDYRDRNGQPVIQDLLAIANHGGGFYRYSWHKPSANEVKNKLGYVVLIPELNWMLGTGLYIDDIESEILSLEQRVDSNISQTFLVASLLLAITLALVIVIVVLINVHATAQADERLRELAHRSVEFQVVQRRVFARELHDGVNQILVSAKLRLNLAFKQWPSDTARDHLESGIDMLNQSIQEVRRVSHNLRPVMLDDLGLEAAMHALLDNLASSGDIEVKRHIRLPDTRLPDAIEMTVYRLIQEGITNVQKHADASRFQLDVRPFANRIEVEMQDNGRGFTPSDSLDGIGMMNMRERLELLGGKLTVRSWAHKGTQIIAVLYLNPEPVLRQQPTPPVPVEGEPEK